MRSVRTPPSETSTPILGTTRAPHLHPNCEEPSNTCNQVHAPERDNINPGTTPYKR